MKNAMQLKAIMKKLAKENQISAQLVLQNYMLERFLERVSLSPYRDNYIIKGGFLISSMVGLNSRATMDMDATIKGYPVTQDAVQKMIEQILTVPVDDDITFTFKSIGEIREGDEYTGYRVALTADFPPMAVPLKLDITTGDKITPREIQYDYKLMLEDRHIQVMAYNLATILAEKLETVISRSDQNTRPRDYYDVYILTKLQAENIDFPALGAALMATASKRGSDSILQDYRAIVEAVRNSEIMRRQYLTHLNRCKAMDSYHRALIYTLTAVPALRNNIESCFDFEKDEIKPESLAAGWQTGGTVKLTRFAYNLWNGYSDKSCTPYDLFDCSFAPYMYEAVKLRYPEYTRQLDDMVIDDVRN